MERDFEITIGSDGIPTQFYRGKSFKLQSGERYFNNGARKMHWYVWETETGRKREKGFHIHHVDGNTWNNRIENLQIIEGRKHLSEHAKIRVQNNPEWLKKFQSAGIAKAPEWHKSPEGIEWHREHAKKCNFGHFDYGMSNCEHCGKEYKKRTTTAKFCHPNCKAAALRKRWKLEGRSL